MGTSGKKVTGRGVVAIYVDHYQISRRMLSIAESGEPGSHHFVMISMVFAALTMEAYLNHIGRLMFVKSWTDVERNLSPASKLSMISEKLEMTIDSSERPFQTFKLLFRYRNWLVHGKTEEVMMGVPVPNREVMPVDFPTDWEKETSVQNAQKLVEDVEGMIKSIHEVQSVDPIPPLLIRGFSSAKISTAAKTQGKKRL